MKKIVEVKNKCDGRYLGVVFVYDGGERVVSTLSKNEYDAQILKEKLVAQGVKEKDLVELEELAYQRGYNDGYDDAHYDS